METLIIGFVVGLFGAIAVFTATSLGWPVWLLFIAWVSYYLFGKSIHRMPLIFLQIVLGMVLGILIQTSGTLFTSLLGPIGFPLAVFFFIGMLALLTKMDSLNNIPAWFIGLIIFFGVHPSIEAIPLLSLLLPIASGIIFAWCNDTVDLFIISKNKAH